MSDKLTIEQRSKIMSSVKGKNTKLEQSVSKELWKRGIRFRKNVRSLYGNPDIAIKKYKIVIFIDSCFWHGCNLHFKVPSTNQEYWEKKINRNKARDAKVNEYYTDKGWNIYRIWEHELKNDFNTTINGLELFIRSIRKNHVDKMNNINSLTKLPISVIKKEPYPGSKPE